MALKLPTLVFGSALTAIAAVTVIWTVDAEPGPDPKPIRFEKTWQKHPAPIAVTQSDHVYEENSPLRPAVVRIHRATDGFVLVAKRVGEQEEKLLLELGFRRAESPAVARDRSIVDHEAYFGYMVGKGGPSDEDLKRLVGQEVKARFRAYQGVGAPMLVEVSRP